MFNTKKELNQLKRSYGRILEFYNNLKVQNNLKAGEIRYLRRQLEFIQGKCKTVLRNGKQYTTEINIGRKFNKYKGKNKCSKHKTKQ